MRSIAVIAAALLTTGLTAERQASAQEPEGSSTVLAGYGEADASWHVGSGSGQYSHKWPEDCLEFSFDNPCNPVTRENDPHNHAWTQAKSYGVQSRLSYRAIVVEDTAGDQVAFVKSDSYLAQDLLSRRAAQILEDEGSKIVHDEIFHMASHNHSSPYYQTTSWGVWLFQDVMDLRTFEYHARAMAAAILRAEENLVPARMGATTIEHKQFKGMIGRRTTADDGTPAGYPLDFGDFGLSVIRFDNIEDPGNPTPLTTLINWGQHPEGLDPYNLITGDFVAPLERFVERVTGAPLVFGQGDVGSAEAGPGHPELIPEGIPRRWSHAGHAQAERGAFLLARDVIKAFEQIDSDRALVPFSSDFDVAAGNAWIPGPVSHPYPSVSNCRTEPTIEGNPGSPIIGLPDCARARDSDDNFLPIWENLRIHGFPVPAHYDAPAFTGVEENLRLHLQAFRMGEVILASCACEAQVDLIMNFESRADDIRGNVWDGYDWTERLNCRQVEGTDPERGWECTRKPEDDPAGMTFSGTLRFTNAQYERMLAQVHNNAKGWDLPENAVAANSEPEATDEIWGNFTWEELPGSSVAPQPTHPLHQIDQITLPEGTYGYKLPIGVGHATDYNGYTVSYREYMAYDHYRKALTSYGPHTADYMVTRLVRLAASLKGGPELEPEPLDALAQADEQRQRTTADRIGEITSEAYDRWVEALPDDMVPEDQVETQPSDISRFEAATFSWAGGSNAVDNPLVRVERRNDQGEWEAFADQSGEVQTMVDLPNGPTAFSDTYSGNQKWVWTANFEAFNAFPRSIGSTPTGTYRFVAEGFYRQAGVDQSYEVTSEDFQVTRWDGLRAVDLTADGGVATFKIEGSYPQTYDSVFPYVAVESERETGDGEIPDPERRSFCMTCSFRPWASQGRIVWAGATVFAPDGSPRHVEATRTESGWTIPLADGETAVVAPGDLRDEYGETNRECFGAADLCALLDGADLDTDGILDIDDNCPSVSNADQSDGDGDHRGDACENDSQDGPDGDPDGDQRSNEDEFLDISDAHDPCDPDVAAGECDRDGDGFTNQEEESQGSDPTDPCSPDIANGCDRDADGVADSADNCSDVPNEGQLDDDSDGLGDACDSDLDGDSVPNDSDNCPGDANAGQTDSDGDASGDVCDSAPQDGPNGDSDTDGLSNQSDNCPDEPNTNQSDVDDDGQGDACDPDYNPMGDPDGDGRTNAEETTSGSDPNDACSPDDSVQNCDADGDGVVNATDNCASTANSEQKDSDGDGTGDTCDETPNGTTGSGGGGSGGGGSGGGGSGGGGSGGGGSGGGSGSSTPPSPTPTQSAAGDDRKTVGSSIAANKLLTGYRKPVTLSGQVAGDRTCATTEIEILARTFGTTDLRIIGTTGVGADGSWSSRVRSARSTAYAARPVDSGSCDGEASSTLDVLVKARVIASVRNRCDARHAVRGRVAPTYPGTFVKLQDRRKGRWVTVGRDRLNKESRFRFERCSGTRVVWPKQDPRNERGRAPVLTSVGIA